MKSIKLLRRKLLYKKNLIPGLNPLLCRLYRYRGIKCINQLQLSAKYLIPFHYLDGVQKAVKFLYDGIINQKKIVVVGDFDVDGATSTAVTVLALKSMGVNYIDYIIPNRFKEGYGLSPKIVKKAIKKKAELIITVDNGISSVLGVNYANKAGISVLITDHHLPVTKILPHAKAIINPNLKKNSILKSMSGVGIAFYLMIAICRYLKKKKWFQKNALSIPFLSNLLDLVALGTITDLVPLDYNNRILVFQGLKRIRLQKCRPGLQALLDICNFKNNQITSNELSFAIGPRINAAGRLEDMSVSVDLLLTENFQKAIFLAKKLNFLNTKRKKIEKNMQIQAINACKNFEKNIFEKKIFSISIYHPNWHQGIVGILASRIKEYFHLPVIAFAPIGHGILKGSGRSVNGLHMNNILKKISLMYPSLILEFGGHAMAVGLSLKQDHLKKFADCFNTLIKKNLKSKKINEIIWSDGPLSTHEMTISTALLLQEAGPWGESFPEPVFDGNFIFLKKTLIQKNHLKVLLQPIKGGPIIDGIAFNIQYFFLPNLNFKKAKLAYKLNINLFQGKTKLQILIKKMWPL